MFYLQMSLFKFGENSSVVLAFNFDLLSIIYDKKLISVSMSGLGSPNYVNFWKYLLW